MLLMTKFLPGTCMRAKKYRMNLKYEIVLVTALPKIYGKDGKPIMARCICYNGFSWRPFLLIMMTTMSMVEMIMVMMTMMMMVAIVTELPGAA